MNCNLVESESFSSILVIFAYNYFNLPISKIYVGQFFLKIRAWL